MCAREGKFINAIALLFCSLHFTLWFVWLCFYNTLELLQMHLWCISCTNSSGCKTCFCGPDMQLLLDMCIMWVCESEIGCAVQQTVSTCRTETRSDYSAHYPPLLQTNTTVATKLLRLARARDSSQRVDSLERSVSTIQFLEKMKKKVFFKLLIQTINESNSVHSHKFLRTKQPITLVAYRDQFSQLTIAY